ncbi:hypothetical protein HAX54_038259 [Datura stramonium]|uniref:RNase H type-1 domain-containing protein n=1 Tax=Datura stramonium TaxID=4076 RepID=A0ABS8VKY4_DATST|nr:hypothetical protein [Datura stramonium]
MIPTTSLVAEARAIREGLKFCYNYNLSNIIIEMDSLDLVNFIEGKWDVPRSVGNFQFNLFQEMPSEGRRIINLEKMGTHQIRRKIIDITSTVNTGSNNNKA